MRTLFCLKLWSNVGIGMVFIIIIIALYLSRPKLQSLSANFEDLPFQLNGSSLDAETLLSLATHIDVRFPSCLMHNDQMFPMTIVRRLSGGHNLRSVCSET